MAPALDLMLTTSSAEQTDRFFLSAHSTTIGRLVENDIQIDHPYISRKHAIIKWRHGYVYVFDTSSSGTWLNGVQLENGGRGTALRYDDVRARTCPARCCICVATHSHLTCMLWQELEFGYPPDAPRLKGNPFRLCATFRLTITSCTPLAQHTPFVQMSAPIPLAADLGPNPDSSALPKSSTSEEAMEPQPKRQCLDELASALGVPPAAVAASRRRRANPRPRSAICDGAI